MSRPMPARIRWVIAVAAVAAVAAGAGIYYLSAGAASPDPATSSASITPGSSTSTTQCSAAAAAAAAGGASATVDLAQCAGAPAAGTRICGQPVLRSPYSYSGPARAFASGQHGLPTYGSPHADYPAATRGVIIPAGDNTSAAGAGDYQGERTVYYFEPGTHVVRQTMFTGARSVYVGGYSTSAGEATINGVNGGSISGRGSSYLSSSTAGMVNADQTWAYLTIKNYGASQNNAIMGNENSGQFVSGNIYKYDTIGPNEYGYNGNDVKPASGQDNGGGYAIGFSGNTTIEYNCLIKNAQGAFNGTGASDVISHNEISWNGLGAYPDNSDNNPYSCGCSGGGKLFFTVNATVDDNYVHDNYNAGIWLDFDNTGADISGNYIASNWGNAIIYEASYNAQIAHNTLVGNGWASDGSWPTGGAYDCYAHVRCTNGEGPVTGAGGGFPYSAIYLPNSGGNSSLTAVRLPACRAHCTLTSRYSGKLMVENNVLVDNFGEVMVYTDTNRFPDNLDTDSACSMPLGALDQRNSKTYYQQADVLYTAADTAISGAAVTSRGGTKTVCDNYGGGQGQSDVTQAPEAGMAVFNLNTGAMIGTVAHVASARSFTLTAAAPAASHVALVLSAYGGCGPADYYRGGAGVRSGRPAAAYWDNCLWASRNVSVRGNVFVMRSGHVTGCTAGNMCGYVAAVAFDAGVPALMRYFQPYATLVANASGGLGNAWTGNSYIWSGAGGSGGWVFWAGDQGSRVSQAQWQGPPYRQDAGSTFRAVP